MPRARFLIKTLLLAALLAVPAGVHAQTGTLVGRVTDDATRGPISGVEVATGDRRVVTDEAGRFAFIAIPAGQHTMRVSTLGYQEATRTVTVEEGGVTRVEISLVLEAIALQSITAIGYGQRRAAEVTGSVRNVTAEEFNRGRIVSPEQLIQGKVAGVQIVDSGEPGGGISLRIRGGTSINASSEPLFVVDGQPLPVGGGLSTGRNALNFLNPDDIESMTILKDASATAIYGSRGANGVVLVQTKSGRRAPAQLTYSGSMSGSEVLKRPELLTAEQFRAAVQQHAPENVERLGSATTDWQDAVQRTASGQEHNVAFAGAGEMLDYRFSLGYLDQRGIIRGTSTERISAALNYGHRLLNDQLDLRASLKGSRTDDSFAPGGVIGASNAFAPTQPIRTDGGDFYEWAEALGPNNPVAELEHSTDESTLYRTLANIEARYMMPFLEGLDVRVRAGYDLAQGERMRFYPSILRWQQEGSIGGEVRRENPRMTNGVFESFLNYRRALGANSNFDATAGYSYEAENANYPSFYAQGLASDLLGPNGIPSAEVERTFVDVQESKLASFFGRVHYSFADRFMLTGTVRRDGSSRFGDANRWGTFPSAAVAWRISDEGFMQGRGGLSDLKLRLSWGVNGNQAFSNYAFYSTYVLGDPAAQVQFGDEFVTTIRPGAVDPDIKWEETTSYNIGLDYGFFDNRVIGAIDFYHKDTEDLIFRVPVAAGTNLSDFVTTNIGSMRNRGVELSIGADVFRPANPRGLRWNASFNAAHNRNELTRVNPFGEGTQRILVGDISGAVGSTIQVLQPGKPINSFFVYRHRRDANGRPIYEDRNDDGTINDQDLYEELGGDSDVINQDDRVAYKDPSPDWILGHTSDVTYRGFDFGLTLRAYLGNYVYNNVASNQGHYGALNANSAPNNLHRSVLENRFESAQYYSDVYVEDGSFLRADNITLGYTFRGFRGTESIRVFGTIQNAFTLTGYSGVDPMAGINGIDNNIYPRSRTFVAGLNVGF